MTPSPSPQTRSFALRSKRRLIAATVLLQAVVIGLGCLATIHMARNGLTQRVHEQVREEAARRAMEFSALLGREVDGPVRPDTPAWERAQQLLATSQPPGGTLLLLDPYGALLCHPALEANPGLRRVNYAEQRVHLLPGNAHMELGQLRPLTPLVGEGDFLGGSAVLGLVYNPDTQTKVMVLHPDTGLAAEARRMGNALLLWMALGGAGILVMTILGSALLVRRYDSILIRANQKLEEELQRRVKRSLAIRNGLIFGLAKLADYRDTDTGKHLERICKYSEMLADALRGEFSEITRGWIELLKLAASMHDIGKVGIADAILLKPGAFTPEERRLMELHPLIGADTLVQIRQRVGDDDLLNMGIQITLSHHERWDGKGYPYGLSTEQIPLAARIVALADMYDALTSKRVYKAAMTHEQAREIILKNRGTHFDARIVDAFERIRADFDRERAAMAPRDGEDERPALVTAVEMAEAAKGRKAA
ncbi:putative cyclic di-GMP phosphodiesterase [Phycisphaerales bacterium]|nr:putative cyclic di-GMP phosphodiesterase [Phycisphaerales bacterium]